MLWWTYCFCIRSNSIYEKTKQFLSTESVSGEPRAILTLTLRTEQFKRRLPAVFVPLSMCPLYVANSSDSDGQGGQCNLQPPAGTHRDREKKNAVQNYWLSCHWPQYTTLSYTWGLKKNYLIYLRPSFCILIHVCLGRGGGEQSTRQGPKIFSFKMLYLEYEKSIQAEIQYSRWDADFSGMLGKT